MSEPQQNKLPPNFSRSVQEAWRGQELDRNITAALDAKAGAVITFLGIVVVELSKDFANHKAPLPMGCFAMLVIAAFAGMFTVFCALKVLWTRLRGLPIFTSIEEAYEYYLCYGDDEEELYCTIVEQRVFTREIIRVKGRYCNMSIIGCIIAITTLVIALFLR